MLMMTGAVAVAAAATILWFAVPAVRQRLGLRNYFGAALLAAWIAAGVASAYEHREAAAVPGDSDLMAAVRSLGPVDWSGKPGARPPEAVAASASTGDGRVDVAPVAALIGGLESRLAAGPADPKGWALLAQSYAFVGRTEDSERAIARAVELGFDEAALRARVAGATRETPHGDWIEQAVRR